MRQAVTQAIHHARHRQAFGRLLISQPLMQNVLADLALESEAATVLMMRLARAFDARLNDPAEHGFARLGTAVAKYWVCKRAPSQVNEALECLGGGGFVEECILPRLYREAPLNSIWEGSGNVICLDILRAMKKEPDAVASVGDEIRLARGADRRFDAFADRLEQNLPAAATELEARRLAERLALALQASLLIRHSIPEVADAFCATRLANEGGRALGTLPANVGFRAIIDRAYAD
jgi:putative acyl-CoA dehydrogenase